MTKHYKVLAEYEPGQPIEKREQVDRFLMNQLVQNHPGSKVIKMARKLISDHRAHLYAVLEWNAKRN